MNLQPLDEFFQKRNQKGIIKEDKYPDDTEIAIGGVSKIPSAICVFDIINSSKNSDKDFVNNISPLIHQAFHIIHTNQGIVDKYTGDGAMFSFCASKNNHQWACRSAVKTALELIELSNILVKEYRMTKINLRIGIDFGELLIERIGVRGYSQLIIIGSPAIRAKRLETMGKHIHSKRDSILLIGYDIYHNLDKENKAVCREIQPPFFCSKYFKKIESFFTNQKPYRIFEYNW